MQLTLRTTICCYLFCNSALVTQCMHSCSCVLQLAGFHHQYHYVCVKSQDVEPVCTYVVQYTFSSRMYVYVYIQRRK
jgi:hypothetical protein